MQLENTLSLTEKSTQALCECFWAGDDEHKKFAPPVLEDGMKRCESPIYFTQFVDHVKTHCADHVGCPAEAIAAVYNARLEEYREKVEAWSFHWWLDKTLRASFQSMLRKPTPRWDIQIDIILKIEISQSFLNCFIFPGPG